MPRWFAPIGLGVVLTLSFLLLMMVFRSLLVPIKAVIMNMLSIAAAYGVAVTLTMVITTVLVASIARDRWGWSRTRTVLVLARSLRGSGR